MNLFPFCSILLISVFSQRVVHKFNLSLNDYNWTVWDVKDGVFFYYLNNTGKATNCSLGKKPNSCYSFNSATKMVRYFLTTQYAYRVDFSMNEIVRNDFLFEIGSLYRYKLPFNYIKDYYAFAVTDSNFYLYQTLYGKEVLGIYDMNFNKDSKWNPTISQLIRTLDDRTTRWVIKNDGLYSFLYSDNELELGKWHQTVNGFFGIEKFRFAWILKIYLLLHVHRTHM